jgi:hypothetical protein
MGVGRIIFPLILVIVLAQASVGLQYAPGYFDFTYILNGTFLIAPRLSGYGNTSWSPVIGETRMWYEDYTGKILVLDQMIRGKSPEKTLRDALKAGKAKGYGDPIVIFSPSSAGLPGFGELSRDYSDVSDIKIPTVEVSIVVWFVAKGLSDEGYPTQLGFIVRDDDIAPVTAWHFGASVISATFLTTFCIACFIVCIYKFRLHLIWTHGITTAKIFFVLDLVANFMRFWYVGVNPFYLSKFDYTFTTICGATHVSLSIICTLLLALKWQELLLKSKLKVTIFLTTFKWPFIIAGTAIFLLEFISSALRGHWYNVTKINQSSLSILLILAFLTAMLLFISGAQILMQISHAVGSKRRVFQLSQTTILIILSGFGLLIWSILQMVFLITIYAPSPPVRRATPFSIQMGNVFQYVALFSASFVQNWAMPIPADALGNSSKMASGRSGEAGVASSGPKGSSTIDDPSSTVDTGIRAASTASTEDDSDIELGMAGNDHREELEGSTSSNDSETSLVEATSEEESSS